MKNMMGTVLCRVMQQVRNQMLSKGKEKKNGRIKEECHDYPERDPLYNRKLLKGHATLSKQNRWLRRKFRIGHTISLVLRSPVLSIYLH